MRRAVFAVAGLAAGTTLLVVVKGGAAAGPVPEPLAVDADGPAGAAGRAPLTPTTGPAGPAESAVPPGRPQASPSGTRRGTTRPAPVPSTAATTGQGTPDKPAPKPSRPRATTPPPPPPQPSTYKVTGSIVPNPYGAVQVQVVMRGATMTDVVALELPEREARSVTLNERAVPQLRAEALREQGADLDTVSGATATSQSYERSLQAALDRAARGERG